MSDLLFSFFFLGKGVVRTTSLFKKKKLNHFWHHLKTKMKTSLRPEGIMALLSSHGEKVQILDARVALSDPPYKLHRFLLAHCLASPKLTKAQP